VYQNKLLKNTKSPCHCCMYWLQWRFIPSSDTHQLSGFATVI